MIKKVWKFIKENLLCFFRKKVKYYHFSYFILYGFIQGSYYASIVNRLGGF